MSAPRKSRRSLAAGGPRRSVAVAPADDAPPESRPSPSGAPLFVPQPTGYRYKGFSPWPCTPLQQGTMIMALVDAGVVFIRIMYAIIWMINPGIILGSRYRDAKLVSYPYPLVHFLIELEFIAADVLLYFGAKNKNKLFCYVYLALHAVHFPIEFFLGVYKIHSFLGVPGASGLAIGDEWVYFLFLAYIITVVVFFLLELKTNAMPSDQAGVIRPEPHQPVIKSLSRHSIKK